MRKTIEHFLSRRDAAQARINDAILALRQVVDKHGVDVGSRIAAFVLGEATLDDLLRRSDLKISTSPRVARLIGARDPHRILAPPGDDHGMLLNKHRKPYCYLFQPYEMDQEEMSSLLDFCRKHKLRAVFDGFSSWFPGRTFRVMLFRSQAST